MANVYYPTDNIHLPTYTPAVRLMQVMALTNAAIVFVASLFIGSNLLLNIPIATDLLGEMLINYPFIIALLSISVVTVILSTKRKTQTTEAIFKNIIVVSACAEVIIGFSTIHMYILPLHTYFEWFSVGGLEFGIAFLLIGLSLLFSYTRIPHRFHYTQGILFIILSISLFQLLESIYQIVLLETSLPPVRQTFFSSLLLFIICQGILLAKPNRGFLGIFTTDSLSGQLARLSLVYFISLPPVIGLVILVEQSLGYLGYFGAFALLVVSLMLMLIIISWINVRFLYNSELRHYLTKESLRINNVSLELNSNDLSHKLDEVKSSNKQLIDKLNYQGNLHDLIDSLD